MRSFRFHDPRHTFRTQGAETGVPLAVMMAQLGHMDRETSLEYVHIHQRAFERAKALIEQEQAEIVFAAKGGVRSNPARADVIHTAGENQTALSYSGSPSSALAESRSR
jgi:hypothetical protein